MSRADGPAYRAPTFTLAAPRERAWWERALVSVGRHVRALRWLPTYRRAVGGRWAAIVEWCPKVERCDEPVHVHSWQQVERCPAKWARIPPKELDGMMCSPRERALSLNLTHDLHCACCTCEVYP